MVWKHWSELLPEDGFEPGPRYGAPVVGGRLKGAFADLRPDSERLRRLVVIANDGRNGDRAEQSAQWIAEGVTDAIADLSIGLFISRRSRETTYWPATSRDWSWGLQAPTKWTRPWLTSSPTRGRYFS